MATLGLGTNIRAVWTQGGPNRVTLYEVRKVSTGDTADIGGDFSVIKQVAWLGATVSGVIAGAFVGVVITAPAGLSSDGAYMLVQGVAAT